MRLVLFGPPGVGKGTFAKLLSKKFHIPHVSTGEITRDEIERQTPLGHAVKELISHGHLLSDDLAVALVRERCKKHDVEKGFIFDGFPRTVPQARVFDDYLAERGWRLSAVVNIMVDEAEIVHRIENRFTCPRCHAIYNTEYWPPRIDLMCDVCGSELIKRSDETPEAIRNRLRVYHEITEPVLGYYKSKGMVKELDGTGKGIEENFTRVLELLHAHKMEPS